MVAGALRVTKEMTAALTRTARRDVRTQAEPLVQMCVYGAGSPVAAARGRDARCSHRSRDFTLRQLGAEPAAYGPGLAERVRHWLPTA